MAYRRLTREQRLQVAARATARFISTPPPIGGWNTRDQLAAMDPTDAVLLDNWYPDAGGVSLRLGSSIFSTGLGGNVDTLAEFNAQTNRKLLGSANGKIFDVSAGGVVGAPLGSGFSNNRWNTANFNSKIFFFNGVDTPQVYDGTTLAATTFTGVTQTSIVGGIVYKNRLFVWLNNDNSFYYGGINAVNGALTQFLLSTISQVGGNILAMTTMSHDGGDGVQDYLVIIMNSGEIMVWLGTDPGDASEWALAGRYRIAAPVSARAVARYGAESYLTTFDDHVPLQQQLVALKVGTVPPRSKISGAVKSAVAANPSAFGWQALYYTQGRRLLFNVPNIDGTFDQHVFNTSINAWTRFKGLPSRCWSLYKDNLYFGDSNGQVWQADTGNTDNGIAVSGNAQQAWSFLGINARKKVSSIRPIIQATGNAGFKFGVGFDYTNIVITGVDSVNPPGSPWDISPWDTSPWSPESSILSRWDSSGGTGWALSCFLSAMGKQAMSWLRTDWRVEPSSDDSL